ncbi:MAG: class II fructose-bisphosphate aldolase [Rectinemataceae bacterium]|jgi:ketose-bisphosphate aldolase
MAIESAKEILKKANFGKYAVGAFNVTCIEQMKAVLEAAVVNKSPVIIQTSVKPSQALGPEVVVAAFRAIASAVSIPAVLHLDHCTDVEYCKRCVDAGYTSIMIDASKKIFEENVKATHEVAEYAHARGDISVEGELGTVAGVEDQIKVVSNEAALCNPDLAERFLLETGVDMFAPAIGTAHGIYETKNPKIDIARLRTIYGVVNEYRYRAALVIHGGTGLGEPIVRELIAAGGSKYNVSTELKHVWIDQAYEYLQLHLKDYDPGALSSVQMKGIMEVITTWMDILGSKNKA